MFIKSFDSIEELFAEIEEGNRQANEALQPWQDFVPRVGDYIMYHCMPNYACIGKIIDPGYEEDRDILKNSHCVLVMGYSHMCKEGEMGSIHKSNIMGFLTEEIFDQILAKLRGNSEASNNLIFEEIARITAKIVRERCFS